MTTGTDIPPPLCVEVAPRVSLCSIVMMAARVEAGIGESGEPGASGHDRPSAFVPSCSSSACHEGRQLLGVVHVGCHWIPSHA